MNNNPWSNTDPNGEGPFTWLTGGQYTASDWTTAQFMLSDTAYSLKGLFWTGPVDTVVGVADAVAHPIQTVKGVGGFAVATWDDPAAVGSAIWKDISSIPDDPERIGSAVFDVALGFATGGTIKTGTTVVRAGKLADVADDISDASRLSGAASVAESMATVNQPKLLIRPYKVLSQDTSLAGQAHHLNQTAAYKGVIPSEEGLSIKLQGNIFTDANAPHTLAHKHLDSFWDPYRRLRIVPTNLEYTRAMQISLRAAGLPEQSVREAVRAAVQERVKFGLLGGQKVPRVPGPIRQLKR